MTDRCLDEQVPWHDPLVYLLGAAAAVVLAAWWLEGRGRPGVAGWPLDAIVSQGADA